LIGGKYMEKEEIFLVDTNILVYAYETEDSVRKEKSLEILEKCFKNGITLALSNQNLAEFAFVSIKKSKLDKSLIQNIINDLYEFNGIYKINYTSKTIFTALNISQEFKMSFWDSLIAATMIENGILNIYTENSKDFKIPQLNVINPFC
jgi:predicted nucleic acid-binding protein